MLIYNLSLSQTPKPNKKKNTETNVVKFLLFLFIYLFGYFIIFCKWSPKTRPDASSCFISIFHGTPAALLASAAIFFAPDRGFSAANTKFQNLVLDFSAAYFAAFLDGAGDLPFVLHHLATLFVLLTCRHATAHGAVAVLALLALAEATSALQNAWALGCARRRNVSSSAQSPVGARACDALSVPFYGMYSVVRGSLGPYVVFRMVAFYSRGGAEGAIATWIWVSWVVVVSMTIAGSVLWVSNLWIEVHRERSRKVEKIR